MAAKIIVGYDGSPGAIDALALAETLAECCGGTLVLSCAYRTAEGVSARIGPDPVNEQRAERARATLAGAQFERHAVPARRRVIGGASTAEALRGLAERERAALLVLGATTRSGLARVSPGSVAQRLMHGAPCALAIAPAGYAAGSHGLRVVGVAFDGGEESLRAVKAAAALARRAGASLRVLRAIPTPEPVTGAQSMRAVRRRHQTQRREAEETVAATVAGLVGEVPVDAVVLEDDPVDALVAATGQDVDLLVAGSRGYGALRRVLVGSVSGRLMRAARCPVCVIPRGVDLAPGRPWPVSIADG